jgi:nitrate/TMAO reductase-like tetraheme cytochrome c subunit
VTCAMPRELRSMSTRCMRNSCLQAVCSAVAGIVLALCLTIPAAAAETPGYAGSETCKTCHEEIYNNLQKTPHFAVETVAVQVR